MEDHDAAPFFAEEEGEEEVDMEAEGGAEELPAAAEAQQQQHSAAGQSSCGGEAAVKQQQQPAGEEAEAAAAATATKCSPEEEEEEGGKGGGEGEEKDGIEEEDDPVVKEIDIYLRRLDDESAAGAALVYLLQYPLRPLYRPYGDQGQLLQVAYREQQHTLHFTYGLSTEGGHCAGCPSMGEATAAGGGGYAEGSSRRYDSKVKLEHPNSTAAAAAGGGGGDGAAVVQPRHALKSQVVAAADCSYAVGILKGSRLYLLPVNYMVQFRPDFSHVDACMLQQQHHHHRPHHPLLLPRPPLPSLLPLSPPRSSFAAAASSAAAGAAAAGLLQQQRHHGLISAGSSSSYLSAKGAAAAAAAAGGGGGGGGRSRISHSKQRELEEAEPWIPIATFFDADSPEAFDIIRELCRPAHAAAAEDEMDGADGEEARQQDSDGGNDLLFVSDVGSYLAHVCGSTPALASAAAGGTAASYGKLSAGGTLPAPAVTAPPLLLAGSSPLSYGALDKLPPEKQVFTILKQRHLETYSNIKRLLTRPLEDVQLLRLLLQHGVMVAGNWAIKSFYVYEDMYSIACRDLLLALLLRNTEPQQQQNAGLLKEAFRSATRLPLSVVNQMLQEVAVCVSSAWRLRLPPDTAFLAAHPTLQKHFDGWWAQRLRQAAAEIQRRRDGTPPGSTAEGSSEQQPRGEGEAEDEGGGSETKSVSAALLQLASRLCVAALQREGALTSAQLRDILADKNEEFTSISSSNLDKVMQSVAVQVGSVWVLPKLGNAHVDIYRDALLDLFRVQRQPLSKTRILQELSKAMQRRIDLPDFTLRKLLRELAVNEGGLWKFKGFTEEQAHDETKLLPSDICPPP